MCCCNFLTLEIDSWKVNPSFLFENVAKTDAHSMFVCIFIRYWMPWRSLWPRRCTDISSKNGPTCRPSRCLFADIVNSNMTSIHRRILHNFLEFLSHFSSVRWIIWLKNFCNLRSVRVYEVTDIRIKYFQFHNFWKPHNALRVREILAHEFGPYTEIVTSHFCL